uniref:Sugar phosphate transporter domain-containing protein n=1 Tax=Alexandrium monilatum TaxID=311494 RepID=A0A7S4S7B9_9DINO
MEGALGGPDLSLMYIVISAGLIRFNKLMMRKDHFPHALALSAVHMVICSVFCTVLYTLVPSFFPGMETSKGQRLSLMKWFVPIGLCFAVMLFGSNQAYMFCSVTFLQFMKEANVMLVFLFSCIVGLQGFSRLRCLVIFWVIVGASISVSGEVHFKWLGFIYQGVSQLAEVSRMIMGEIVLSGRKLDPLTYNMFLAPICLLVLIVANAVHWSPGTLNDFYEWWPLIIANACVAFCLNIIVATVIKECSAVGFVLAGLTKDIAIVLFSALAFHENVTQKQAGAFVITILGVGFWSYMKIYPSSGLVCKIEMLLGSETSAPGEKATLLPNEQPTSAEKRV